MDRARTASRVTAQQQQTTRPIVGVLAPPNVGLPLGHGEEFDFRVVVPGNAFPEDVEAWVLHAPTMEASLIDRLSQTGRPCLVLASVRDRRRWAHLLAQGEHDVMWLPGSASELVGRLTGLLARSVRWNQVSGSLVRMLAHDLLGTVQAVDLNLRSLQRSGVIPEDYQEEIVDVLEASNRIELMLRAASNLGRHPLRSKDQIPLAPIDLAELMERCAANPALSARVELLIREPLPIMGSDRMLRRAFDDVVRTLDDLSRSRTHVQVEGMWLGSQVCLRVRAHVYPAAIPHLNKLFDRAAPILLREAHVPVPMAALAYAREVARSHEGDIRMKVTSEGELTLDILLPSSQRVV